MIGPHPLAGRAGAGHGRVGGGGRRAGGGGRHPLAGRAGAGHGRVGAGHGRVGVGGRRAGSSARGSDGGFATVEFVVLFPLVLFAIALILQLSFWGYRRSVAIATAQDIAADAAARGDADSEFLHRQLTNHGLGGLDSLATSVVVVAGVGGSERVQVSIDGSMPALIGPFNLPIHAVASATVERFRA